MGSGLHWRKLSRLLGWLLMVLLVVGTGVQASELVLHFLDVGQGDSILIQTPEGANILVDAGDSAAGTRVVVPYLKKMGVKSLDLVVMTHPHFDHIGGLVPVLTEYPVREVLADGQVHTTAAYERLLGLILEKEIPFTLARSGDRLDIPGLDEAVVLNPQEPFLPGLNNNSVVLKLRYGSIVILLAGDIELDAEERILGNGHLSGAQILKVAHHGSRTSTTRAFLEEVRSEIAVISVGEDNIYGLPDEKILAKLGKAGAEALRTDLMGTIVVISDGYSYRMAEDFSPDGPPAEPVDDSDENNSCSYLVNVNTATYEELMELPGIGPVLALRIMEGRAVAPFEKPEDLLRIKGIGPKRMKELASLITF